MSTAADLDRVLDVILVDCYGEDEQYTSFLTVLQDEIALLQARPSGPDGRKAVVHCR